MIKIGMLVADRYEILEKIGTGGMSDVYKAKDHKLGRNVAVKVLKQEFSENANFVSKFRVEAQAAAGLMHPNIVNVYDVGEEKGLYYIVMELVEGITLKRYIEKKARLSVREAVSIAIQVSMGLEAAHKNHVIHRDIKPQNIIISKDGKVKVTDFGIAKAATSNTITSNVMGSVHYTSPEQARGGYSDEKSDIYSLGITLFEMLTGRVPFNGETTVAIAIKHIQEPMPSPCDYVPEIPRSVEQIVLKCCEKRPDRRYQSMDELVADLKESLIHPDEDFVQMVDPETESATRTATEEDRETIRRRTNTIEYPYDEEGEDPEEDDYPRESVRRRERREQQRVRLRREYEDEYEDEYDDYDGPRIGERILGALAVIGAIILGVVILYLAAKALGLWPLEHEERRPQETNLTETVVLDDYVGMTADEAKEALTRLGVDAQVVYEESQEVESGRVMRTSVEAGQSVEPGSQVVLTVSTGTNGITVPTVTGFTKAEAKVELERKNFKVAIQEAASDTVPKDKVISQDPAGGASAPNGSTVVITISSGEDTTGKIKVPTLTGMSEQDATALLLEAGLKVGQVSEVDNSDANLSGLVSEQSITPGTMVEKDTAIDLSVAKNARPTLYQYEADILPPTAAEDPSFKPGTQVHLAIIATDGTVLKDEVTSLPTHVRFTGIKVDSGNLRMVYQGTSGSVVTVDADTGETVTVEGEPVQKSVDRSLSFTPMEGN